MKNLIFTITIALLTLLSSSNLLNAQDSPYVTSWKKDGVWLGAGLAGTATGFLLIQSKDGFTEQEIAALDGNNVNGIDRFAVGNFDENASKISDIPFYSSFAIPFAMMATGKQRSHAGQLSLLYMESLTTSAALFTISAGLTNRARPKAYNTELSLDERMESTNTRSFYSGHVAVTATSTFFAAKVYSDFYPESEYKWLVWSGAAAIPAFVGAYRIKGGQHFLTDVALGYVLGAASGILIPELHKKKNENLSYAPIVTPEMSGIYVGLTF